MTTKNHISVKDICPKCGHVRNFRVLRGKKGDYEICRRCGAKWLVND